MRLMLMILGKVYGKKVHVLMKHYLMQYHVYANISRKALKLE